MCWFFWDVLVFLDAMIFCNNFARWLQKIVATCDVLVFLGCVGFSGMCWFFWDVLVFLDAMIFCNNFAR
jgi:hypothetical protein